MLILAQKPGKLRLLSGTETYKTMNVILMKELKVNEVGEDEGNQFGIFLCTKQKLVVKTHFLLSG